MQTKYLCVLIHIWIKGEVGAPLNQFKPSSKIFYWPFQGGASFVYLLCFCSVLCLQCLCAHLFICALWSPAGKGLTSWLSFVVSNCECVTFPLVSWVGCGNWLYRLLIFAPLLTSIRKPRNQTNGGGGGLADSAKKNVSVSYEMQNGSRSTKSLTRACRTTTQSPFGTTRSQRERITSA